MTKRKDGQKLNHKERDIRNKCIPEWKVSHGLSKKQHQKEEKNEKQEKAQPSKQWAQNGLWYPGSKTKESIVPQNSRITL